ncbi:hypothetical protein NDU88_005050 [Pleurodeles waltl]|uniref:Uncharacterized protein n=1 Tax=Pleurodeles waltl TaxID=8319 RepID=A0AAV7PLI5_PLEWA|nr:hypothetical protein NDU88_005050 [Pleurodeles waltl]
MKPRPTGQPVPKPEEMHSPHKKPSTKHRRGGKPEQPRNPKHLAKKTEVRKKRWEVTEGGQTPQRPEVQKTNSP